MKKNLMFAMFGVIALTGAVGLASCSSNDDVVDVNPTYDPVEKTVTTQFVLNIASGDMKETRQSAAIVQKADNFRGMKDAMLIGLSTGSGTYGYIAPLLDATSASVKQSYDLGTLYGAGNGVVDNTGAEDPNAANPTNSENRNSSSNRVVELTLPTGTDAMLVYGRAIPTNDDEENGKVDMSIDKTTVKNTAFGLVSRLGDKSTEYANTLELAAIIMNRVLASQVEGQTVTEQDGAYNGYTQEANLPGLTWKELAFVSNISSLKPLEQNLAKTYQELIKVYSPENATDHGVHSGSAPAVGVLMKDIYTIASSVAAAKATGDEEYNAQRLANRIKEVIGYYFNTTSFTFNALGSPTTENTPADHLVRNTPLEVDDFEPNGKYYGLSSYLQGLPTAFGLPEGVAQLEMTELSKTGDVVSDGEFTYKTPANSSSLIDISSSSALNVAKYMYPAEILYFDNSLLRVNDIEKDATGYPNGYNTWDTSTQWTTELWTTGAVSSTTRSVAVKNNINYGVSLLKSNVILDGDQFADNREDVTTYFTEAQVKEFKLTGILIGGQYQQVGWNYLSNNDGIANKDYIIYDNNINGSGGIPTTDTGNAPNYTLVFDNFTGSAQTDQQNVKVALEFENGNKKDIYGLDGGIIPKGCKFYLVGELTIKLSENSYKEIAEWPRYYAIPPYNSDGTSKEISRVFIQDYMTTATFKIGLNSLKSAYNTVPDLRASQTTLGLSVDLNWRPGLSFETTLGQ